MATKGKEPNNQGLNDSGDVNVQKNKLFSQILKKVKKVNFVDEIQKFGGVDKPSAKHYQVIAIKKLIDLGTGFRYTNSNIYIYNGTYWESINEDEFKSFIGNVVLKMGINNFDSIYYRYRNELLNQFISVAYTIDPEIDKDIVNINLSNGTLEISNGIYKMKPYDKEDFLTYQLHFSYDEMAIAPIFEKYLDRVLPDKSVQDVLSEYLGYIFIKNGGSGIKIEKMLALKGTGANGKSVLFEVVRALLGIENVTNYSLEQLTDNTGYYRAEIGGKLLNYASETKGRINESEFKKLASGEPANARSPYGRPFELSTYAKTIVNLNKDISSVEHINAFFRRFILIPFDITIPEDEQDKKLHHKIINAELPGVMNWILKGLDRLLKNDQFTYSKIIENELKRFKTESNSVALFLQDQEYYVCDCETPSQDIYTKYVGFCVENGYIKVSHIEFNRRLKQLQLENKKVNVWKISIGKVVNISNIKRNVDLDGDSISPEEEKMILEGLELPF